MKKLVYALFALALITGSPVFAGTEDESYKGTEDITDNDESYKGTEDITDNDESYKGTEDESYKGEGEGDCSEGDNK